VPSEPSETTRCQWSVIDAKSNSVSIDYST
jgi:hypothetical protein